MVRVPLAVIGAVDGEVISFDSLDRIQQTQKCLSSKDVVVFYEEDVRVAQVNAPYCSL
jgi:hypothetical protein